MLDSKKQQKNNKEIYGGQSVIQVTLILLIHKEQLAYANYGGGGYVFERELGRYALQSSPHACFRPVSLLMSRFCLVF